MQRTKLQSGLRLVRDDRPTDGETLLPWYKLADDQRAWLQERSVFDAALGVCPQVGTAHVTFYEDHFEEDPDGSPAFIFVIHDSGEFIDFAAWDHKTGQLGTWRGFGFAINQDAISNPASRFDGGALRVHANPLAWLKAERDGIVIANPARTYAYLRNYGPLSFADPKHGQKVRRWWKAQAPCCPEFLIEVRSNEGVAVFVQRRLPTCRFQKRLAQLSFLDAHRR